MLSYVRHASLALQFKFLRLEEYRYSLPVIATILFILSLMQSVVFSQMLATSANTIITFSFIITLVKFICMVIVLQTMLLGQQYDQKRNLFGFILLTEGLLIPIVLSFFVPILSIFAFIWQIYILIVQFRGLIYFSGKKIIHIIIAYVISWLVAMIISVSIFSVFVSMDLIDLQESQEKLLENWNINQSQDN